MAREGTGAGAGAGTKPNRTDKKWRPGSTLGRANVKQRVPTTSTSTRTDGGRRRLSKAEAWAKDREGANDSTQEAAQVQTGKRARDARDESDEKGREEPIEDAKGEGDDEQNDDETDRQVRPGKKGKRQNRKTGGTGKKVKVFVEQKNDLLNLAASITGQAEEKSKAKLEKLKQRPAPAVKDPKQPSKAKQEQMDAARNVVAQRSKQKKHNKKADLAPPLPKVDDGKKRVSFA